MVRCRFSLQFLHVGSRIRLENVSSNWFAAYSWERAAGAVFAPSSGVNPKALALQKRTRAFLRRVIAHCDTLPKTDACREFVPQLLDAAGSTDSNYRGACRARSRKEFIAKIGVAAEEADESKGWLEALTEANLGDAREATSLIKEADELTAIFVSSQNTAKRNDRKRRDSPDRNDKPDQ